MSLCQHIDNLKKENFNIKLRVHFLEERLAQLAPDQIDAALKQNINLKIEVQQRGMEIKKLKKLVLSLERELERLQHAGGPSNRSRERELEEKLEERQVELMELRRRKADFSDEPYLRETEARNAELEEELESTKGLLQENMEEIDRLREIIEQHGHHSGHDSTSGDSRRELKMQLDEVRAINNELDLELEDRLKLLRQHEDEKEELLDQIDDLHLKLEDFQRRREAESIERSESRAQILEEREEKEVVVENLNSMRDKHAALIIELQQREDELELKAKEIEELVTEHQRIVEVVEEEWKGEVEEARTQVEELRDVGNFRCARRPFLMPDVRFWQKGRQNVKTCEYRCRNLKPTPTSYMPNTKLRLLIWKHKLTRRTLIWSIFKKRSTNWVNKYII